MQLRFLGTRGYIEERSRLHRRHSALLVSYHRRRIMIDCGEDWLGTVADVAPHAIVLTHAHPDHAFGLRDGAPCPVHATAATWQALEDYPIEERRLIEPRQPVRVESLEVEAFPVIHSLRAPAVGFRIRGGRAAIFYVPDVIDVEDREAALDGIRLFVGDGASLTRPLVRRRDGRLFGHTTVRAQIGWCAEAGVDRAIFTHLGGEVVAADGRRVAATVAKMGRERGVDARIAHDGLEISLR